jgi:Golgi apparatus protein 1
VFYYTKMEVENYKNDIILAEACREDVDKYCANVEPGQCWWWLCLM